MTAAFAVYFNIVTLAVPIPQYLSSQYEKQKCFGKIHEFF